MAVIENEDVAAIEEENKTKTAGTLPQTSAEKWRSTLITCLRVLGLAVCLYLFLVGIELMGTSFKVLGGKGAGQMFHDIPNGLAGLMIGVVATVMVQSSSTSTSVVVAMVAAGQLAVRPAVPIIMGANIGTTVTNTIVSMGHVGDRVELERAFAGATVHDMFNLMSVAVMFPIEELFHPIERIASGLAEALLGDEKCEGCDFESPLEVIVKPVSKLFVDSNKNVIYSLSLGEPSAEASQVTVASDCSASGDSSQAVCGVQPYWCVHEEISKTWAKISTHQVPKFSDSRWSCEDKGIEGATSLCDSCTAPGCGPECVLGADVFYEEEVAHGDTIKAGLFDMSNAELGGSLALVLSLILMMGALTGFVKFMHALLITKAKDILARSTNMPGPLAILIGTGITIVVQSSSVTTSALTPLVGLGVLKLENMFPLTLGANIGTCSTSVIAAFASMKLEAMTISFCHLTFNLLGIAMFYPIPFVRRIPIYLASVVGMYASVYRWFPIAYILAIYVAAPLVALGVSFLFQSSTVGGIILLVLIFACVGGFVYWWSVMGGCYLAISKEQRAQTLFGQALERSSGKKSKGEGEGTVAMEDNKERDEGDVSV